MGKITMPEAARDEPPEQTPVDHSQAASALREVLRMTHENHSAERREAARRMSQQAHRFATTEVGLSAERAQLDADIRVRRVLNALREKDEDLATAEDRIEELQEQKRLHLLEIERLQGVQRDLETTVREWQERCAKVEQVSAERRIEASRLKGQLADTRFDLDLQAAKYERLLNERATFGLAQDLVAAARAEPGQAKPVDAPQKPAAAPEALPPIANASPRSPAPQALAEPSTRGRPKRPALDSSDSDSD